ncbi:hypothetical protein HDU67_002080 [Dinochytrium kinnereticum]|nr:hypothetical protein HDU67_002080 [Dinochytrium kinnereticum]
MASAFPSLASEPISLPSLFIPDALFGPGIYAPGFAAPGANGDGLQPADVAKEYVAEMSNIRSESLKVISQAFSSDNGISHIHMSEMYNGLNVVISQILDFSTTTSLSPTNNENRKADNQRTSTLIQPAAIPLSSETIFTTMRSTLNSVSVMGLPRTLEHGSLALQSTRAPSSPSEPFSEAVWPNLGGDEAIHRISAIPTGTAESSSAERSPVSEREAVSKSVITKPDTTTIKTDTTKSREGSSSESETGSTFIFTTQSTDEGRATSGLKIIPEVPATSTATLQDVPTSGNVVISATRMFSTGPVSGFPVTSSAPVEGLSTMTRTATTLNSSSTKTTSITGRLTAVTTSLMKSTSTITILSVSSAAKIPMTTGTPASTLVIRTSSITIPRSTTQIPTTTISTTSITRTSITTKPPIATTTTTVRAATTSIRSPPPPPSYNIIPFTKSNIQDSQQILQDPSDPESSPNGWTGTLFQNEYQSVGNNVRALDRDSSILLSTSGRFDNPYDITQDPLPQKAASVAQVFYMTNMFHDIMYRYGFTESAGNFQVNNFGKGGKGNGRVNANVQSSKGFNNANFFSPPDGQSGTMNLFLFTFTTPRRDGAMDNGLTIHELTHGMTNRLTGGSGNANCLQTPQSRGLGEGWSDTVAWWSSMDSTMTRQTNRVIGAYVFNNPTIGARAVPYSTSLTTSPRRYSNLLADPTNIYLGGEIWSTMLYEVYWNMVDKSGRFERDLLRGSTRAGNIAFMRC